MSLTYIHPDFVLGKVVQSIISISTPVPELILLLACSDCRIVIIIDDLATLGSSRRWLAFNRRPTLDLRRRSFMNDSTRVGSGGRGPLNGDTTACSGRGSLLNNVRSSGFLSR